MNRLHRPTARITAATLALGALLSTSHRAARAQPAPTEMHVFSHEARVEGGTPGGLARLPLTAEVLEHAAPDFSDVRLFDGSGVEVPYLVDRRTRQQTMPRTTLPLPVVHAFRHAERQRRAPTLYVERFELDGGALVRAMRDAPGAQFELAFSVRAPGFVASAHVEWQGAAGTETLVDGSLYRFESPRREGLRLTLPRPTSPTPEAALVVVELRSEEGYLEPGISLEQAGSGLATARLRRALQTLDARSEGGFTTLRVRAPRGLSADRLIFTTNTRDFAREVTVESVAQGRGNEQIGQALLYRVGVVPGAERLWLPVRAGEGEELIIRIHDQDSPPLEGLGVSAELTRPSLVFRVQPGLVLRFGGGRTRAPRYDLGALTAQLGDAVGDGSHDVSLGPAREDPVYDPAPALGFASRPGRVQPVESMTTRARVTIHGAREGSSRLRLSPALLAAARPDLGDVRVLDDGGRQRPYIVGATETETVEVEPPRGESASERTSYDIAMPASPLFVSAIALPTSSEFVDRHYRLVGTLRTGGTQVLSDGILMRRPGDTTPLTLRFSPSYVAGLRLEIDDGGDAPLVFEGATLSYDAPTLFVIAPDGDYWLYCGDAEASAPAYELNGVAEWVLDLPMGEATLGDPEANPAHVPPRWYEGARGQTALVWIVLLLALLILTALTLRVARATPNATPADPTPEAETSEPAPEAETPEPTPEAETSEQGSVPDPDDARDDEGRS